MANLFNDPDLWIDADDIQPAAYFDGDTLVGDILFGPWYMYVDAAPAGSTLALTSGSVQHASDETLYLVVSCWDGVTTTYPYISSPIPAGAAVEIDAFDIEIAEGLEVTFGLCIHYEDDYYYYNETDTLAMLLSFDAAPHDATSYNCDCDDDFPTETLAELRQKVLIEMGYSAQLTNPPANIVLKINQALEYAQKFAYHEFYDSKLERFFTWNMSEGVRFYDIPQNSDACTKKLNSARITWVGVQENNDRWYPMVFGIPPEFYTEPQITTRPNRYEIRQCIEVWPAPGDGTYKLRIKGEFGLLRFTEDTDITTIDPDVIFYGACFRLMRRRGDPDADDYAAMQQRRMEQITESSHFTARYVPGVTVVADQPRPIFPFMED